MSGFDKDTRFQGLTRKLEEVRNNRGIVAKEIERGVGGLKILEIGRGENSGVEIKRNDVYIGVDVLYKEAVRVCNLKNGTREVLINDKCFLPVPGDFAPDLVICVAPNPDDIDNGLLFDYEEWIRVAKKVIIVLEDRTINTANHGGVKNVARKVAINLRQMGRKVETVEDYSPDSIRDVFKEARIERDSQTENSRDLGGGGLILWSTR